ncbi:hypothetical protein [Colwellia sp. UCD-KL20]|uniref:hypothetical protein n=1 Tax=Colwellia sp. UCD-KL20 TaxID=1917165 RepID=UPI0009F8D960|nr:hypothetical protein [Colwellia sp. UCD-KL20]
MILDLFKTKPVIEDSVHNWIADTYAWAITHLNGDFLKNDSQLILPTNKFYPGRVSSVHEMAQQVFSQTVKYAGMENWPLVLVEPHKASTNEIPKLSTSRLLRGASANITIANENTYDSGNLAEVSYGGESITRGNIVNKNLIEISYNPAQVNQPQDLVSSFAQILASLLVYHSPELPPGGKEYIPQTIDLVACFMGFGVIFSNTAFQFKGGCGSCNNRQANRQSTLTELETVYCLAVFCQLKNINKSDVLPHLKRHLKSTFKGAVKQLNQQTSELEGAALLSLIK